MSVVFALSPIVGLSLFSLLIFYVLFFFPGQTDRFYIYSLTAIFITPYAFILLYSGLRKELVQGFFAVFQGLNKFEIFLFVMAAITSLSLFYYVLFSPLYANDPLLYFEISRYIHNEHSFHLYPMLSTYKTGYYQPSWHPPGYHALIVWSYLFLGKSDLTILGRMIAPFFTVSTAFLLYVLIKYKGRAFCGVAAAILFLGTPILYTHSAISHIDPMRVATFFAGAVAGIIFIERRDIASAIILGVVVGLSMRVHAISVFNIVFIGAAVFLLMKGSLKTRIFYLTITGGFALLICGFDWVRNFLAFQQLIPGTEEIYKVYSIPELHMDDYNKVSRSIYTFRDVALNGLLNCFTNIKLFSFTYWLMLGGIAFALWKSKHDTVTILFLLQIVFYFVLVALTVLAGKYILIKNPRYWLLIQPFVIYFSALALEMFYDNFKVS